MMFPIRFQNRTHFDSLMRFLENAKIKNDNEILFVILSFIAVEKKMILTFIDDYEMKCIKNHIRLY